MSDLEPITVPLNSELFHAISSWQFGEEFVPRILTDELPYRMRHENAELWAYRDARKSVVGFGSLVVCQDYREFTGEMPHPYIPLLAVHPDFRGLGYGEAIVRHLIREAQNRVAITASIAGRRLSNLLFLDVYEESVAAIRLYKKCEFQTVGDRFHLDPTNQKPYYIMAQRV